MARAAGTPEGTDHKQKKKMSVRFTQHNFKVAFGSNFYGYENGKCIDKTICKACKTRFKDSSLLHGLREEKNPPVVAANPRTIKEGLSKCIAKDLRPSLTTRAFVQMSNYFPSMSHFHARAWFNSLYSFIHVPIIQKPKFHRCYEGWRWRINWFVVGLMLLIEDSVWKSLFFYWIR